MLMDPAAQGGSFCLSFWLEQVIPQGLQHPLSALHRTPHFCEGRVAPQFQRGGCGDGGGVHLQAKLLAHGAGGATAPFSQRPVGEALAVTPPEAAQQSPILAIAADSSRQVGVHGPLQGRVDAGR